VKRDRALLETGAEDVRVLTGTGRTSLLIVLISVRVPGIYCCLNPKSGDTQGLLGDDSPFSQQVHKTRCTSVVGARTPRTPRGLVLRESLLGGRWGVRVGPGVLVVF